MPDSGKMVHLKSFSRRKVLLEKLLIDLNMLDGTGTVYFLFLFILTVEPSNPYLCLHREKLNMHSDY